MNTPKTLEELKNCIESIIPVGPPTDTMKCATGEFYTEFNFNGVFISPEISIRNGKYVHSEEEAISGFWNEFVKYANTFDKSKRKLYWGEYPILKSNWAKDEPRPFFNCYALLLISEKSMNDFQAGVLTKK